MTKNAILLSFAVGFSVASMFTAAQIPVRTGSVAGAIDVVPAVFRAETIRHGVAVHARFILHNRSEQSIDIRSVTTSCQCTHPKLSSESIPPSGESVLTAVAHPEAQRGTFDLRITLEYQVGGCDVRQTRELSIVGTIDPEIQLSPEHVQVSASEAASVEISLRLASFSQASPLFIQSAYCPHPSFHAEIAHSGGDGEPVRVMLRFNGDALTAIDESRRTVLQIVTNNSTEPVCLVPIQILDASPRDSS